MEDAEIAEDGNPKLKFDLHQEPDRGTFTEKISNTIVVDVETYSARAHCRGYRA
jgi:hypothetical protein